MTQIEPVSRHVDRDSWRWYVKEGDENHPENWYASVTQILRVIVHERLQEYMIQTNAKQQTRILAEAADYGTKLHELVAQDLAGKQGTVEEPYVKPWQAWLKLRAAHNIQATQTEFPVHSDKYGYAGTLDFLGEFDGKPCVMDLKTGRYPIKAGWQLGAYKQAYEEQNAGVVLGMVGLSVRRDGFTNAFVYEHYDACLTAFLATLQAWKMLYYHKLNGVKWRWLQTQAVKPT